jgi:hypothetical protein
LHLLHRQGQARGALPLLLLLSMFARRELTTRGDKHWLRDAAQLPADAGGAA